MKIAVTNTVALNGGDAAILLGLLEILRNAFGQSEIRIYDNQPTVAKRYYGELNFRRLLYLQVHTGVPIRLIGRLRETIERLSFWLGVRLSRVKVTRWLAKRILGTELFDDVSYYSAADLIVSTGGTYLVEHYSLESRIFDYNVALYFGKPLIFFTQSLGPFKLPKNQDRLRRIFDRATLVLLRDNVSICNLRNISVQNPRVYECADAAFALPTRSLAALRANRKRSEGILRIAISVREWNKFDGCSVREGMERYVTAIKDVTEFLTMERNAEVVFVSTCQGIPEYWTNDSTLALAIWERLSANAKAKVSVDRAQHSPSELVELLAAFDILVSTRLHMAILGFLAGLPVVPISYEFKTQELFKRVGMEWPVESIEDIKVQRLTRTIDDCLEAHRRDPDKLYSVVENMRRSAFATAELLQATIPSSVIDVTVP